MLHRQWLTEPAVNKATLHTQWVTGGLAANKATQWATDKCVVKKLFSVNMIFSKEFDYWGGFYSKIFPYNFFMGRGDEKYCASGGFIPAHQ